MRRQIIEIKFEAVSGGIHFLWRVKQAELDEGCEPPFTHLWTLPYIFCLFFANDILTGKQYPSGYCLAFLVFRKSDVFFKGCVAYCSPKVSVALEAVAVADNINKT